MAVSQVKNQYPFENPHCRSLDGYCCPVRYNHNKQGLDYFIPEGEEQFKNLPGGFRGNHVVLVLAGRYFTKRLPAEKYLELISKAHVPYILLGGKNEKKLAKTIEDQAKGNILNLCHKLSINQSASIIKNARLVINNDTGLMHIAAAYKKKILSIWRSTTPAPTWE